jgi:hypothetical protein
MGMVDMGTISGIKMGICMKHVDGWTVFGGTINYQFHGVIFCV